MALAKFGIQHKNRVYPDINVQLPVTKQYRLSTGAFIQDVANPIIKIDTGFADIVYTNASGSGIHQAISNRCVHTVNRTFMPGGVSGPYRVDQPGNDLFYQTYGPYVAEYNSHSAAVAAAKTYLNKPLGTAYLGSQGQAIINALALKLRPDLTTVSIPNFLAELEDVKSLFRLWQRKVSDSKNVAGAALNYNFGWKPTIGDVGAMVNSVKSLTQKLNEWEVLCGVLRHGKATYDSDFTQVSGSFAVPAYFGECRWSATLSTVVTGGIAYRPQPIIALSHFDRTLRGLLDTLGFQLNPRIIWDALPFTFVIDWFFGVGNWLEGFSFDALELPIQYVDSYVQYKQELKIESNVVCYKSDLGSSFHPTIQSPGMVTTENFFHRMPIFPDYATLAGLGWKFPTPKQTLLLVALSTVLSRR